MISLVVSYNDSDFGRIRATIINGKPYFVSHDIAVILKYDNAFRAIQKYCKGVIRRRGYDSAGHQNIMKLIPEDDVCCLVYNSSFTSKEEFMEWISDIIIPLARQDNRKIQNSSLSMYTILSQMKDSVCIEDVQGKAESLSSLVYSDQLFDFGDVAKILDYPGIGSINLYRLLRQHRILMDDNTPYQQYINAGYFYIKTSRSLLPSGVVKINTKTFVRGRGVYEICKILDGLLNEGLL